MSHYRRCYVPGGSYFFTVVTERRARILGNDLTRDLLRAAFRDCLLRWPAFQVNAIVMLPDHLHAIWTLPPGDDQYSKRWGAIKKHFTQSWLALGGVEKPCSDSRLRYRRRGILQRRFIEHTLRDENDYARHFDYIHYNPMKHGLVTCPRDWPYSTFHRWVRSGVYGPHWAVHQEDCSISPIWMECGSSEINRRKHYRVVGIVKGTRCVSYVAAYSVALSRERITYNKQPKRE